MTLTDQQRVMLAGIGGWPLADTLLDPDRSIPYWKGTQAGGTWVWGTPWRWGRTWYQVGPKRITVGSFTRDAEPLAAVTWTELRRFAGTLTEDQHLALAAVTAEGRAIAREDADDSLPLHADRDAREAQQQRWEARHERHRAQAAEQQRLLDDVLGVTRQRGSGNYVLLSPTAAAVEPDELALFDLTGVTA